MTVPELAAFAEECEAIEDTLARIPTAAWNRPALGEWDLHALAAHLVRSVGRIDVYLEQGTDATEPERDRVSYFRFDADAEAPKVADRARQDASKLPPEEMAAAFHERWRASVARAEPLAGDHLLPTVFGAMTLREYTATRILEAVVHHIDIRRALDLAPTSTPAASRITMGILEGLLGERRPRNFGRDRFILVATGRLPSDDPRFPVLR